MRIRLLVLVLVFGLIAVACSSAETSDFESAADNTEAPAATEAPNAQRADAPVAEEAMSEADQVSALGTGAVAGNQVLDIGRSIVFKARVDVAVEDVVSASDEVVNAVERLGGFVFGQETTGAPNPRTVLVFKVRPDRFRDALSAIGDIGELRSQAITADDVTERVVDLQSQITTSETSVDRLRELLAKATDLKTITDVEQQLLQRETQLELLRGQLRTIEDSVSLATITLTISEAAAAPAMSVSVSAYLDSDESGASCPGDASLRVEEDTEVTVCVEILNTGDTMLGSFELRDPVLDLKIDDFTIVYGVLDRPIEPGESVMISTVVKVERDLQTRARVSAIPLNIDGEALEGRAISQTVGMQLQSIETQELPGFLDGFQDSIRVLLVIWGRFVAFLGAAIPFAVVIGTIWFVVRWVRTRFDLGPKPKPEAPSEPKEPIVVEPKIEPDVEDT